jgi:hypothetical protein
MVLEKINAINAIALVENVLVLKKINAQLAQM